MTDEELLEYISESSTMSKAMDEYDGMVVCPSVVSHARPYYCTQLAGMHSANCRCQCILGSVRA